MGWNNRMKQTVKALGVLATVLSVAGCLSDDALQPEDPTLPYYTKASESGLSVGSAYPRANDVCRVANENAITAELVQDDHFLIACPKHERGAIEERRAEGGVIVFHAKHWSVLRIHNKRAR